MTLSSDEIACAGNPGGAELGSMLNLFAGGLAGSMNIILTGGMGFTMGWHFGWWCTFDMLLCMVPAAF